MLYCSDPIVVPGYILIRIKFNLILDFRLAISDFLPQNKRAEIADFLLSIELVEN